MLNYLTMLKPTSPIALKMRDESQALIDRGFHLSSETPRAPLLNVTSS